MTDQAGSKRAGRGSRAARLGRVKALFGALLALALILSALSVPASAKKTHLFKETFGSAAQPSFGAADSLAVEADGDLLVIDSNAKTVSRWNADGTPENFAALGTNVIDAKGGADLTPQNGFTFGGFAGEQQVAINNSCALHEPPLSGAACEAFDPTDGNIYVTQGLQAAGNLVDIFAASGAYLGQLTAAGATKFGTVGSFPFSPCGVAVDGAGNVFVAGGYDNEIYKFDPAANPPVNGDWDPSFDSAPILRLCNLAVGAGPTAGFLFANTFFTFQGNSLLKINASSGIVEYVVDPGEDRLVAVDPVSGHVFGVGQEATIREFNASGGSSASLVSTFSGTGGNGIAVDGPSGNVYLAQGNTVKVYGPSVTVPEATTKPAEITGDTSARLHGTVNPDGEPLTECFFEYDTAEFQDHEAAGKEGEATHGQTAPCVPAAGGVGSGSAAVPVQADLGGLQPETLYHYRLVAKNANAALYPDDRNSAARGADQPFKTPGKPSIKAQWAADVTCCEATLRATINPENSPTSYRIEWGTSEEWETSETYGQVTQEVAIGAGDEDRVVSQTLVGLEPDTTYHWRVVAKNGIGTTEGADREFRTYAPTEHTECPNDARRVGASAGLPDCRAYEMVSPVDKAGDDIVCPLNGIEIGRQGCWSQSTPSGEQLTYSALRAFGDSLSAKAHSQYIATRLPGGWSSHGLNAPQGTSIFDPGFNANEEFANPFWGFTADLSTAWTVDYNAAPLTPDGRAGCVNVYQRDNTTDSYQALTRAADLAGEACYEAKVRGFSEDGSRVFFDAARPLTENAASHSKDQVYEFSGGAIELVSLLPNGNANPNDSRVGNGGDGDGWARDGVLDGAVSEDGSRIFWSSLQATSDNAPGRIYVRIDGKETVPVSESVGPGFEFRFWQASPEGSKALFSGSGGLYVFDVETETPTQIAGGFLGVAGASEDLSRVYFSSTADLDESGPATAGDTNLYLYEAGEGETSYAFVAELEVGDSSAFYGTTANSPIGRAARVTPEGRHLAFMSARSLTPYDNADAATGEPAAEVYLYDAAAGELHCASCNPSGARPIAAIAPAPWTRDKPGGPRAAAWIPTRPWSLNPLHPLSDDGSRLFFNSYDALLPHDTNGAQDVYQWEAAGSGDCEEGDANHFSQNGGCLSLISTGQSTQISEFVEASPDGESVFFTTASGLVPEDPGLIDIYVARVGGGFPRSLPPNPCLGDACQVAPPPPEDPTPASSAFEGAGNVRSSAPRPRCRRGKRQAAHSRKGRCKKRSAKGKRRGAGAERRAAR